MSAAGVEVRIADRADAVDDVQHTRDQQQDRYKRGASHSSIHGLLALSLVGLTSSPCGLAVDRRSSAAALASNLRSRDPSSIIPMQVDFRPRVPPRRPGPKRAQRQ